MKTNRRAFLRHGSTIAVVLPLAGCGIFRPTRIRPASSHPAIAGRQNQRPDAAIWKAASAPYDAIMTKRGFCSPTAVLPVVGVGDVDVWVLEPTAGQFSGTIVMVPGWPGSIIDWATQAHEFRQRGFRVVLWNPPGHARPEKNSKWHCTPEQYGSAVAAVLNDGRVRQGRVVVFAHSTGTEWVYQAMLAAAAKNLPLQIDRLCAVNPWWPGLVNKDILWGAADDSLIKYSEMMISLFGPSSKDEMMRRLFYDVDSLNISPGYAPYLEAEERRERQSPWPIWFSRLLKSSTIEQKRILDLGKLYESSEDQLAVFKRHWDSKLKLLVIESTDENDRILGAQYRDALVAKVKSKLAFLQPQVEDVHNAGHMAMVEKSQDTATLIAKFLNLGV